MSANIQVQVEQVTRPRVRSGLWLVLPGLLSALSGCEGGPAEPNDASQAAEGHSEALATGDPRLAGDPAATGGAPAHQWTFVPSGRGTAQKARDVAVDEAGNVIVVGHFGGELVRSLSSAGALDGFVLKLSPAGKIQWSLRFGGAGDDSAASVAVGSDGRIVVAGTFSDRIDLDGTDVVLTSAGGTDALLLTITPEGEILSAQPIGGADDEEARAVALAPDGSPIVALKDTVLGLEGDEIAWGALIRGRGGETIEDLATDADGAVYVAGLLSDAIDTFASNEETLPCRDVQLAKLSSKGEFIWSRTLGDHRDRAKGLAVTDDGVVHVTGTLESPLALGGGPRSGADVFVASYDGVEGVALSETRWVAGGEQDGRALTVDPSGVPVVAGTFEDRLELHDDALVASGVDGFIASIDGDATWALPAGGAGRQAIDGLAALDDGSLVVIGTFDSALDLAGSDIELGRASLFVTRLQASQL